MLSVLLPAHALLSQSQFPAGILVADHLGVGITQGGRWRSMDSAYLESWPKQKTSSTIVKNVSARGCFLLGEKGSVSQIKGTLKFHDDGAGPGDRGWIFEGDSSGEKGIVWFGKQPVVPKVTFASNSSSAYLAVVRAFLAAKGMAKAKPILHTVALTDLDGNGNQEALIFSSSRPDDDMYGTFSLTNETKHPNDFSLVLVRSLSKGAVKTTTLYFTDGRRGSLQGHCRFAGLWNLDGRPGLEIVYRWTGYESWATTIAGFAKGKVAKYAEAGDGV